MLGGEALPLDMLNIIYTSNHWVLDEVGQPLTRPSIEYMVYHTLGLPKKKGAQPLQAIKTLTEHKHALTVKVAAFARRRKHDLIPKCIEMFAKSEIHYVQERHSFS